jgi:glycerol-3-phosphate dehydrogenase
MLSRSAVERFLDERGPCSIDDVRRGTRLGMGPCQGGFCTFRAAGLVAEREAAGSRPADVHATTVAVADGGGGALLEFVAERYRGTRPIAWGRQLQELWFTIGLYQGVLGSRSLIDAGDGSAGGAGSIADGLPPLPEETHRAVG